MADWLQTCLVHRLLYETKNLPKNATMQNVLCLLIIYNNLGFLVDFCSKRDNKPHMSHLLRNVIIDDALFENSVKPLWQCYATALPDSILTIVTEAIKFASPLPEWIFAIPLIHLLKEHCKPFDVLHCIEWDSIGKLNYRYV